METAVLVSLPLKDILHTACGLFGSAGVSMDIVIAVDSSAPRYLFPQGRRDVVGRHTIVSYRTEYAEWQIVFGPTTLIL